MKKFKNTLHIIIAFASVFGFIGGWASLAHSRKPIQPITAEIDPLPPMAPVDLNPQAPSNSNNSLVFVSPSRRRSMFTTRGS